MARWEDIWTEVRDDRRSRTGGHRHTAEHTTSDHALTDHFETIEGAQARRRDPSLTPRGGHGISGSVVNGRQMRRESGS